MDRNPDGASVPEVERRSPDDVFGLLASEIRVEILRALGETPDEAVPFSALFDRVGVADSGNFNYHLGELLGSFVRKDGGYELTHAGRRIVGAIHAGTYTANATVEPISVGWECGLCGGEMLVDYADERVRFRCAECDEGARFSFPPGNLDQFDRTELPAAFARWWHHLATRLVDGFCGRCGGRLDRGLARPLWGPADDPHPAYAEFACHRCGSVSTISIASVATFHPIVEGFLAEHGFDVAARHPSQIWGELDEWDVELLVEEPPRLALTFGHDGERVTATIEADATVSRVRRRPIGD